MNVRIMRWMHWAWADLCACPASYLGVILEVIREDAELQRIGFE